MGPSFNVASSGFRVQGFELKFRKGSLVFWMGGNKHLQNFTNIIVSGNSSEVTSSGFSVPKSGAKQTLTPEPATQNSEPIALNSEQL